jgi:hypothetical protein
VNGQAAEASLPYFATSTITPGRKEFTWEDVDVLLVAGVSPPDDETPHGWYVLCNGRMVLDADKSVTTGWGDGVPQFHVGKYRHFLGYAYFRSNAVEHLPWRTTKQGVDSESVVYKAALREMRLLARPVLDFLNDLYPSDVQPDGVLEREVLRRAASMEISQIPRTDGAFTYVQIPRLRRSTTSIQYRRPDEMINRIREHLDCPRMSASRVGETTFDYFVEHELD